MHSINQNEWATVRTATGNDASVAAGVTAGAFQAIEYIQGQLSLTLAGATAVTLTMYIDDGAGNWVQAFDEQDNLIQRVFTGSRAAIIPLLKAPTAWVLSGWVGIGTAVIKMLAVK